MFDNTMIDTALGLVLVFALVGLMTSTIQEGIASLLALRARTLKQGLEELLTDPGLNAVGHTLLNHGLMDALRKGNAMPSYIPSDTFAKALTDIVLRDKNNPPGQRLDLSRQNLFGAIDNAQLPAPLKQALLALANDAAGDVDRFKANVAGWFDATMDRVSGWYKRYSQGLQLGVGFAVAAVLNLNAVAITNALWNDATLRAAAAAEAQQISGKTTPPSASQAVDALQKLPLPIGWSITKAPTGGTDALASTNDLVIDNGKLDETPLHWAYRIFGWLIIAISALFGAPFWFDALQRIVSIRGAGTKPDKGPQARVSSKVS